MKNHEALEQVWRLFPHTFAVVASSKRWHPYKHLLYLGREISRAIRKGDARIIVSMPPRHGKSEFTSFWLPAWFLETFQDKRVIIASHGQELASNFGRKIRNEMASNEFFRNRPRMDSEAANRFDTTGGGGLIAAGVGGPITGKGADLFLIDDPYKDMQQARSVVYRARLEEWYDAVARTRLEPGGSMILIMTRWHEHDLAGKFLQNSSWQYIRLPALAEENDPLGRAPGQALCPERYDEAALNLIRTDQTGTHTWEALYQQNPLPIEGGLFKRAWWRFYRERPAFSRIYQFWDCAQKVGISNDYSVCATWGQAIDGFYLIDLWRQKVEAPQLQQAVHTLYAKHSPQAVYIEDKSSGSSLIQYLRQNSRIPVIAYDPGQRDKEIRASAATPLVESGKCFLPLGASFVEDFIQEHERFPNVEHDDQCFVAGTKIATLFGEKNIEDIRLNDIVITPFGTCKVLEVGQTGMATVIKNHNLVGTNSHKIFNKTESCFTALEVIQSSCISQFSLLSLIKWRYKKLLSSTEYLTGSWGRESIILANQKQILAESVLRDFMSRFMNFILARQFQKVSTFTTKTAILTIMTFLTWSAFRLQITQKLKNILKIRKNIRNILTILGISPRCGIEATQEENGTPKMQLNLSKIEKKSSEPVDIVQNSSTQNSHLPSHALEAAHKSFLIGKVKVYNLKTEHGVYYANRILVSNCDTTSMMAEIMRVGERRLSVSMI